MLKGVNGITNSNISVATSGISGPDGGSKNKPVGLVFIGVFYNNKYIIKKFNLIPVREKHREIVATIALNMIRKSKISSNRKKK